MENKTCTKCKIEYPATLEYFFKHSRGRLGLDNKCKKCKQAKVIEHYKTNQEVYKETHKRWVKNNPITDQQKREEQWSKIPAGVYGIKNIVNGKMYVGQSKKPNQRWYLHRTDLRLQKHSNKHLQTDFNKYGDVFIYGMIKYCDNKKDRLKIEKQYQNAFSNIIYPE